MKPKQQQLVELNDEQKYKTKDVSINLRDFPVYLDEALVKISKRVRRPKNNQAAVLLEEAIKKYCKKLHIEIGG